MNHITSSSISTKATALKALLIVILLFTGRTVATAQTTIDFGDLSAGTAVTNQYASDGLTFSLVDTTNNIGGGTGATYTPSIGIDFPGGISNSPTGNYPTADALLFFFASPVTVESFTFDNYGANYLSLYSAYDSHGTLLGTGSLGLDSGDLTTLNLSGVSTLQFSNGEASGSWEYVVTNVTYQASPEPATWAMLLGSIGVLFLVTRFRSKLTA